MLIEFIIIILGCLFLYLYDIYSEPYRLHNCHRCRKEVKAKDMKHINTMWVCTECYNLEIKEI